MSEKVSCHEFADILAWHVLSQIKESRDVPPNPELRCFAQSVKADADAETIDNEILFLLSFCLSQICARLIDDRSYLDELIPRFLHVLASQRSSDPSIPIFYPLDSKTEDTPASPIADLTGFEGIAIYRYEGYIEPYSLDCKVMTQQPEGMIPWKFMLSQFGKNLRSDFEFGTDHSDWVPAILALGTFMVDNMEVIKKHLDKLGFGKGTS